VLIIIPKIKLLFEFEKILLQNYYDPDSNEGKKTSNLSLLHHITTRFKRVSILWDKVKLWHSRIVVVLLLQWRTRIYGKTRKTRGSGIL